MKKSISILLTLSVLGVLLFSCIGTDRCKESDYPSYYFSKSIDKYFYAYRDYQNSYYWIYKNVSSGKIDSVYSYPLEHYQGEIKNNLCDRYYETNIFIQSEYLDKYKNKTAYYACDMKGSNLSFLAQFFSPSGVDTIQLPSNSHYQDSLVLPDGNVYYDVINVNDSYWFAPEVGLVQYLSYLLYDSRDTFYLDKFYKK